MRDGPRKGEEKALITRETFRNFSKLFRLVRKTTVVEIFPKFFQKIFSFFLENLSFDRRNSFVEIKSSFERK